MTRVVWNLVYGEHVVALDHKYLSLYWHGTLRRRADLWFEVLA